MGIVKQYNNNTKTSGITVTEPTPIDDRMLVHSEDVLTDTFTGTVTPEEQAVIATLHDGLIVQIKNNRREYVWTESAFGLLDTGYTYPPYANGIYGQDYGDKTYNFVVFDRTNKIDYTFLDITADGIFISKDFLPYHIINNMSSAIVTLKSSTTNFEELEYPDKIKVLSGGLMLILDPKPVISEVFKITVS